MTLCWWCCHAFDNDPLHLPYKYDAKREKFETTGHFCSWGCMKAFTLDKYGTTHGGIICMNIVVMRKKMTGNLKGITKAPNRYALKCFGGTMSIDEFRSITSDTYPIVTMPDESYRLQIVGTKTVLQEMVQQPTSKPNIGITNPTDKMAAINNSSTHNEPLRLKRPKPLKRDQNNLESSLGIVRKKK